MNATQKTHTTVGVIILVSLAAYWYSASWYFLIPVALMGFGLLRAGITGNCPMTNLYEKAAKKATE